MVTLGVIIGNRGFFPDHLCGEGRIRILKALEKQGIKAILLSDQDTKFGSVETAEDARKCARLFKEHAHLIDGILVTLPNFGDEQGVADAIRWSGLRVPVLVHAFQDDVGRMTIKDRRDSFCGKISVCNNLRQYGIPFTLTRLHTVAPEHPTFEADLADFAVTCRAVKGLRGLRVGALGARPAAFKTVRFSEKLLERAGISVETLDLFELLGRVNQLKDDDPAVQAKLTAIKQYIRTDGIPETALVKMAKLGVEVDRWMRQSDLHITAIQCWTAIELFFGVVPCTIMSMLSEQCMSSACEVDVTGAISMHILASASGQPSALVDWNNNYGEDPDKVVIFHCSNFPKSLFYEQPKMDYQEIIAGTVGKESTFGTVVGRVKSSPFTFLRITTDDLEGKIRAYVGEGELLPDPLSTFGGYGVCRIPNLQKLLAYVCKNGFEHHVAVNLSRTARGIAEALSTYMGWDVYHHQ